MLEISRACAFAVAASPSSSSRYATVAASDTSARMRHASIPVLSCARFALDMRGTLDTCGALAAPPRCRSENLAQMEAASADLADRATALIHQQNSEERVQERHT